MTDPNPETLEAQLDAYLAGDLSLEDAERVRAYVEATSGRRGTVAGVLAAARGEDVGSRPLLETSREEFFARIDREEVSRASARRTAQPLRSRSLWTVGVSALLLLMLGVGATWLVHHESSADIARTYHTAPGQQSTIRLADGSTLQLAPATSVTVSATTVHVTGEVYVAVAPQTSRPFTVQTRNASVHVLGTRFTVRQYATDRTSQIVVEDGKVALQPRNPSGRNHSRTVLTARMLARVTDSTVTVSSGISTDRYTGWTDGRLVFDDVSVRDVLVDLSRAYGTEIQLADAGLAKESVSMTVSVRTQPLSAVLTLLTTALDAHYTCRGATFVIAPGRTVPRAVPVPRQETQYGR